MTPRDVLLGLLLSGAIAANGHATPPTDPPFSVTATWTDIAPSSVTFDENGQPVSLQKVDSQSRFETSIPRGALGQRRRGTLTASYADGNDIVVPVRLVADRSTLNVAFLRAANVQCVKTVVEKLERGSQDFRINLRAYFEARELSTRPVQNNGCGSWAKLRVRQAWVDRSYNLATQNPQFLFDEEAASALAAVAPDRRRAIEQLRVQANSIRFKLLNDAKLAAISAGDYDEALTLNSTLLSEVDATLKAIPPGSSALDAPLKAVQGLSLQQLNRDGAFIDSLSASQ